MGTLLHTEKREQGYRNFLKKRLTTYELRVRRMRRQERLVEFMCRQRGVIVAMKYRDYRFWECISCGFDPEDDLIFDWFSSLHWRQREELLAMSRFERRHIH